ncbi:MAG: cyclolysin secretion protein CyaE [Geothermobacteraceae bacterium]
MSRWLLLPALLLAPFFTLGAAELPPPQTWDAPTAVAYALHNSPDSRIAAARIGEAEAMLQQAGAADYPRLSLAAGYTQTDNPMYSFGNILNQGSFTPGIDFNDPGRTDNLNLTASLRYRLYNGGRDQARQQAANAGIKAAQAAEGEVRQQLELAVFRAYQHMVDTRRLIEARENTLESIRSSLAVARARFNAGDLLKVDLLNLEVQMSQARENLIQSQHDHQLAQKIFLRLLGLPEGEVVLASKSPAPVVPDQPDISRRPELERIEAELAAATAQVREASGGYLPTVDGVASYQFDQGSETGGEGNSWLAGLQVSFNLFDGHLTAGRVAQARSRLTRLRAERDKLVLQLNYELTRARLNLEQAEQRLEVTRKLLEQATESEHLSRAQFKAGVILVSDLIDSENRLIDARIRNLLAESRVRIAVAELRVAAGLPVFPEKDPGFRTAIKD